MRIGVAGLGAISIAATVGLGALSAQTQAPGARPASAAATAKPVPRTPWGHPDLQGTWDYRTITPLERPREFGTREFYTEEEKKTLEGRAGRRMDAPPDEIRPGLTHAQYWTDPGRFIADGYRTSLIIDPRDGRVPPQTAEGRARAARAPDRGNSVNASWLDRGNAERCITYGLPNASLPTLYNNNIRIVQSPDSAVVVHEMIHEARVVTFDGRPRLNDNIRGWIGSTRGWWEGDTLVVETTNHREEAAYGGASSFLKTVERFTPTGPDTIEWSIRLEDPHTWTRPWSFGMRLTKDPQSRVFEYACHEGNEGLRNTLKIARDAEKAQAK